MRVNINLRGKILELVRNGNKKVKTSSKLGHPRMESHKLLHIFLILLLYRVHVLHSLADLILGMTSFWVF